MANLADKVSDVLDKVQSPTSRSGNTVERVAKMIKSGVDKEVIAMQMTKNSATKTTYTVQDVETMQKIYADCNTRVLITKKQANGLIRDQEHSNYVLDNPTLSII